MPSLYIRNRENTDWIEIGGTPGGGAPPSALYGVPFVTIGNSGVTTAERALTAGAGILMVDGGANGAATLFVDPAFILGLFEGTLGDPETFAFFMGAAG